MSVIPKAVLQNAKALISDRFEQAEIAKVLQLIYNAGYRKGLKARRKDEGGYSDLPGEV